MANESLRSPSLSSRRAEVLLLGGTGFVGRALTRALTTAGYSVSIPTRHLARHRDMCLWSGVTLIDLGSSAPADWASERRVSDENARFAALFDGQAVLINLVGILNEPRHDGRGFEAAHVDWTQRALTVAASTGISRYLHMSALQADAAAGASFYLRSKGRAEDWAHQFGAEHGISVTSFRPSVIFGAGDSFLNRFAQLAALMPGVFPLACPDARFAPVFVGDVAQAMVQSLGQQSTVGQRIDLCGPKDYTLKALVSYAAATAGHPRWVLGLPDFLSRLQARVLEWAPGQPFTRDNYASLQVPSVCPEGCARQPTDLESIAPSYLQRGV